MKRYEELGLIGHGAMGDVLRVRDLHLGRTVAMKRLSAEATETPGVKERFLTEARTTAQLEHPGIIPVYDIGEREGRPYFTMKEVRGRTLTQIIRGVHRGSQSGRWVPHDGWSFRRILEAFRQVCDAVAYAHDRGIIHRDLKPENVMIGDFGEVTVMDWGLATTTADDALVGTPAYMPPEQAWGRAASIRSDVYGLGGILYMILSGRPPHQGKSVDEILERARKDTPPTIDREARPIAEGLVQICAKAMAREPGNRYPDAGALSADLDGFSEGEVRREKAMEHVRHAEEALPRIADTRSEAHALRHRAEQELDALPTWAPPSEKRKAWALLHTARELDDRATLLQLDRVQRLRSALQYFPGLPEANRALADHYRDMHASAERSRDHAAALRHEVMLRAHDTGTFKEYLKASGQLNLHTHPEGARVVAHRLTTSDNLLQSGKRIPLGRTPLLGRELPMGSYILELNHPGRRMIRYPVYIERQKRWSSRAPGEHHDRPARLPTPLSLSAGEVLISAGWFVSGGDDLAEGSLPRRRVWIDDLVTPTFPVTNRDYLAFLNALVESGRAEQAQTLCPRQYERRSKDASGDVVYHQGANGLFELDDESFWKLDWPVVLVTWHAATQYARWKAAQDQLPWRLPTELEWEKMARGVDARTYPWGDTLDPSFACVHGSHKDRDMPASVRDFPWDVSPYGVRGLGGNVRDWCADRFTLEGSMLEFGRVLPVIDTDSAGPRAVRGGHWQARSMETRSSARAGVLPDQRSETLGFRLVRSIETR